jgi:hypothetical protein
VIDDSVVRGHPRASLVFPGSIVSQQERIIYHPVTYEREFKYVAYFVEHTLGWTIRLDRAPTLRPTEPFPVGSVVEAMMPFLQQVQWSLPRLDACPLDKYPIVSFEHDLDIYHVAWIV